MNERAAEVFEDVFAGCIVERGNQPMAPGEMLPLRLPEDAVANPQEADAVEGDERPPPTRLSVVGDHRGSLAVGRSQFE